jgi:hypothetical protein
MRPVYEVHWLDAYVSTSEISLKKAETLKPCRTITIGFLVSENDEGITLAMDYWPKSPKQMKAYTFIPWGMVEAMYEIRVA